MKYVTISPVIVWASIWPVRYGKRYVLPMGKIIESAWGKNGYAFIEQPSKGYVALALLQKIQADPPVIQPPAPGLVAAIQAEAQKECYGTYANILLRPAPKVKDAPIPLSTGEVERIKKLLDYDANKIKWVIAEDTKRIYMVENGRVKITSISAYYSGTLTNYFNVLERYGHWVKVETLRAGSGWHNNPIPPHLLHNVYGLSKKGKLINPPCGNVVLPIITRTGYGLIEDWQLQLA